MASTIRKAVFPAAGLGTRFLPATKAQPKEMLVLVDKPVIQYGVEEAVQSGVDNIIIVTGRGKNAIEDHFDVAVELESLLEKRRLAALLEKALELDGHVEVVFNGVLAAAGDNQDVVDARFDRLLDAVLDDRLVDENEHFLGLSLRRREKPRSEPCRREDGLADGSGGDDFSGVHDGDLG